jgi:hypothetical protein
MDPTPESILHDADTAEPIAPATPDQIAASDAAAAEDGGAGIFHIDAEGNPAETGRRVYAAGPWHQWHEAYDANAGQWIDLRDLSTDDLHKWLGAAGNAGDLDLITAIQRVFVERDEA